MFNITKAGGRALGGDERYVDRHGHPSVLCNSTIPSIVTAILLVEGALRALLNTLYVKKVPVIYIVITGLFWVLFEK